ncbi:MAG: hypothetical protein M3376_04135 [Actinomycetota bacterium]|nr:hypothetical protein [Actinomycetota bacterium]
MPFKSAAQQLTAGARVEVDGRLGHDECTGKDGRPHAKHEIIGTVAALLAAMSAAGD